MPPSPPAGVPARKVFITGASSGLGRGLALHYALNGAVVHAAARRQDELENLAAEAPKGSIVPVRLDVQDHEALVAAIEAAGDLDLIIANAGIGQPTSARKMDWKVVRNIMDVNVTSACVTIAAALPRMVARNSGHVVAVSSLAAFRGMPGSASYCASKAALHTWMESVRVDLARTKVRATTIYPGFVKTEMTAKNKVKMPFLMELSDAVKVMARGLDRGDKVIAYPLPMVAMVKALGAVPRGLYETMAGRARLF
ncbi:MAG TPA: SDR family NAD(P)-dependent oxidoreductase [Myxococcales bacterium]|jgi:NADP-dependent 3-hydroxy acid dehydrogenase YdfG|nr:SDR family NAD(P)-dependent oxidoreductase [Myxococcales bacterium]